MTPKKYHVFGLTLASDYPLAFLDSTRRLVPVPANGRTAADLSFSLYEQSLVKPEWNELEASYASPFQNENSECASYLYRYGGYEIFRFLPFIDFYLSPSRIGCHLKAHEYEHLVELRLLGPVLSYWLECRGIRMLHASAVAVAGGVVAFLSGNRGGKTSLAAQMMKAGYPLLSDDVLPIEQGKGSFYGRPAYPGMRMWPGEAAYFLGDHCHLSRVHPSYEKRRVSVGAGGFGTFCATACPLIAIYVPNRISDTSTADVAVAPLSPSEAFVELIRCSFIPFIVEAVGLQPERLSSFAELARSVHVRRLTYQEGFHHLEAVAEGVLADLDTIG